MRCPDNVRCIISPLDQSAQPTSVVKQAKARLSGTPWVWSGLPKVVCLEERRAFLAILVELRTKLRLDLEFGTNTI